MVEILDGFRLQGGPYQTELIMAKTGDRLLGARAPPAPLILCVPCLDVWMWCAGGVDDEELLKMVWYRMTARGLDVIPGAPSFSPCKLVCLYLACVCVCLCLCFFVFACACVIVTVCACVRACAKIRSPLLNSLHPSPPSQVLGVTVLAEGEAAALPPELAAIEKADAEAAEKHRRERERAKAGGDGCKCTIQ